MRSAQQQHRGTSRNGFRRGGRTMRSVLVATVALATAATSATLTAQSASAASPAQAPSVVTAPSAVTASAVSATTVPAPARDGLTMGTALASCWDVKATNPAAGSGLYWLYTPGLGVPQQFYCDMTTDGGGWVLIGRGRQGWSFLNQGQGKTSDVSATLTGTAAFDPRHLDADTVNGLLNGGAVKSLADGIRVRRATNAAGTTWQESRMYPNTMNSWSWVLNGGWSLRAANVGGLVYSGGTTGTAGTGNATNVIVTTKGSVNTSLPGFGFGSTIKGAANSTGYLWSPTGGGNAIPFAQVFIRPTVRWNDLTFDSLANGAPASARRAVADNVAESQPAGVAGLANGFSTERDTEVRALAQAGQRMFVGGNFARVNRYTTKTSVPQSYLAAFDVKTGEYISDFTPKLNGKVNAIAKLPNGDIAVGGEFTTVNGVARAGLVVLDPNTGEIVSSWPSKLEQRASSGTVGGTVTGLSVSGDWLYASGVFTHVSGGTSGFVYAKRGVRMKVANGQPDSKWNPAFNGTPIFVEASKAGDRVYFGGFFTAMNDGATPARFFAVVGTGTTATAVGGLQAPVFSASNAYQQTGIEIGDRFYLGGSEHSFFTYDRSNMQLVGSNITRNDVGAGGDFQASTADGDVVYSSCHCILSNNYEGSILYSAPQPQATDMGSVRYVGAYDRVTGRQLDAFLPQMKTRAVRGSWALTVDSEGCLWEGGDTTETKNRGGVWQASEGLSRWCKADSTPPGQPTKVKAVDNGNGTTTISWTGINEPTGTIYYRLYRGDTVEWTGYSWKATVPTLAGTQTFRLQSYDKAGNLSATTEPLVLTN